MTCLFSDANAEVVILKDICDWTLGNVYTPGYPQLLLRCVLFPLLFGAKPSDNAVNW